MGAIGAAAGAVCGVVASYAFVLTQTRHAPTPPEHVASRPASPQIVTVPVPATTREVDLRPIEERLARLEDASRPLMHQDTPPAEPPDPSPTAYMDRERERGQQAASSREEEHNREERDPIWSARANADFGSDLAGLGASHQLRVESVDCRSRSCFAYVNWPTFREARASTSDLLHHDYRQNCARLVYLPPPENPDVPYRARVDFNCTNLRTPEEPAPPHP